MATDHYATFEHIKTDKIDSLNVTFSEYRHSATGSVHYHLQTDNPENVFIVGLRTVPTDSTGVAHILEHSVLCGSERYPVRDPFFLMLRRSLNTFMNAFTSSDWTAYPFASQNKKDFNNLLEVYLDAVFFSRIDPLDFAQEGHRLEFEDNNSANDLVFKGVVFNEMKGSMSSPVSKLWHTVTKHLFPTVTYHHNSGGEPKDIPNLSYEALQSFYKKHYHPSNAVFVTYGDIPAIEHQQKLEALVLSRFNAADSMISVPNETRFTEPKAVEECYAYDDPDQAKDKTHVVLAWLLGESSDCDELFAAEFISHILLENSASPLLKALETTELGNAPSPICGIDDSGKETIFIAGLEGSNPEQAEKVEKLILETLQKVVEEGIPEEQQHAVLHQLELHHREITGGNMPYGLQLIFTTLTAAMHRGDPVRMLDVDTAIKNLRKKMQSPDYIPNLIKQYFLDNPHRLRLTLKPDTQLSKIMQDEEKSRLHAIKESLSDTDKQAIIEQTIALKERQESDDDPSILPKVSLADIPETMNIASGECQQLGIFNINRYEQATNGLIYIDIIKTLPNVQPKLLDIVPYYNYCFAELGCGNKDYLQTQAWQSSISGGIGNNIIIRSDINNEQQVKGLYSISGKALARNHAALFELLHTTQHQLRFDELPRIRELMAQYRAQREQIVTQNGHTLAMNAAASGMSPTAELSHLQYGLLGIQRLKNFEANLSSDAKLAEFAERLAALHETLLMFPSEYLLIAEPQHIDEIQTSIGKYWQDESGTNSDKAFRRPPIRETVQQLWITNTQVNFCAKAFPTVPVEHPDAAALTVLGGFLRNGYLHRAIREQGGAYGGGASHDTESASFRFYSYRDPRLTETLDDFDYAIDWLLASDHSFEKVEEAILGVISGMDKPTSPAGEAKKAFYNAQFGRDKAQRQAFRHRILAVTANDLQRVGETYLIPSKASCAVITNQDTADGLKDLDMEIYQL